MTDCTHRNPVVNLENFLPCLAECEKQNSVVITERCNRAARGKLCFDVLAAVGDRLNPTIRLFDHATVSLKTAAILLSGKVVIPSRDTILMSG